MSDPDRDLRRDEVFVGGTELPQEWARDDAYADYRVLKASGWWGRAWLISLVLLLVVALFELEG